MIRPCRNPWVTQGILGLIDERRKFNNPRDESGKRKYKSLKNEIDRKCKVAKENWLQEQCKGVVKYA